jgi:hypothetical protein
MTVLRATASALVLVGGLVLGLSLLRLADGDMGAAGTGVVGLALLAAGLVLVSRTGGRRSRYGTAAGDPPGLGYGAGSYGYGSGSGSAGWAGDSGGYSGDCSSGGGGDAGSC